LTGKFFRLEEMDTKWADWQFEPFDEGATGSQRQQAESVAISP